MNAISELTLHNSAYRKAVELYVWEAFKQDTLGSDVTSALFLTKRSGAHFDDKVEAHLTMGDTGILAGIQEAEWFLERLGVHISYTKKDGDHVNEGDVVMKIMGKAGLILAAERTLLNTLQRMSGVATGAFEMKRGLPLGIQLLSNRKTLWGMLDKRAVFFGGGGTHRLGLGDAVLIKDNHLHLVSQMQGGLENVFRHAKKLRFVEIELESKEAVMSFIQIYSQMPDEWKSINTVVMLDNFTPAQVRVAAPLVKAAGLFVEVSGGITAENIKKFALPGVDFISSGALTTKASNLDISLHIN